MTKIVTRVSTTKIAKYIQLMRNSHLKYSSLFSTSTVQNSLKSWTLTVTEITNSSKRLLAQCINIESLTVLLCFSYVQLSYITKRKRKLIRLRSTLSLNALIHCSTVNRRLPQGSDCGLRRPAVSVIGGPGLAVRTTASVESALHRSHTSHPHGLVECVSFVLEGRQVEICNTKRVK